MASNARNLSKLLGTSTQVPTTALPQAIADLETIGTSLSGGNIAPKNISSNTLTQSFDSNQTVNFIMSDSIDTISPIISVFKEVPQPGVSSKGNWDVNANATNYEFFDEKPISYSNVTLTPSVTGDGTFTSSNPVVSGYDISLISNGYIRQINATSSSGGTWTESAEYSSDGTKIYFSQRNSDIMKVFSLSTAYDITTIAGTSSSEYTLSADAWAIRVNSAGTKIWVAYDASIEQFTLSSSHDISTASSDGTWTIGTFIRDIRFNDDGTKIYIADISSDDIKQYSLTTAYDITGTKTLDGSITGLTNPTAILFNSDGSKLYYGQQNNSSVYVKNLGTLYDITTNVSSGTTVAWDNGANSGSYEALDMSFNSNGTRLFILHTESASPYHKFLSEFTSGSTNAFNSSDVGKKVVGNSGSAVITSTAGAYKSVTAFADTSTISSWQLFGAEGKSDGSGVQLSGYSTSTPVIFPTSGNGVGATMNYNNNVSSAITNIVHVGFNSEGTIAIVMVSGLSTGYKFTRYDLSIPFDLSTLTEDATKVNTNEMTSGVKWLWVHPDGTKIWISDTGANRIKYFTMSTAWDPSTASYVGYYYFNSGGSWNSTSGGGGAPSTTTLQPYAFEFNSDGTKLLVGYYDNSAYNGLAEYTLSTAYDMSTMTYVSYVDVTAGTIPYSFVVSEDGLSVLRGYSGGTAGLGYSLTLPSYFSVGSTSLSNIGNINFRTLTGDAGVSAYAARTLMSYDKKRLWLCDMSTKKIFEITGGTSLVHPYSQYFPALTNSSNGQINSSAWQDINSMTADETKNGGDIFYAVSTDNRTSWGVAKGSDGVRKIARNNSGTWQYNNDAGTAVGFDLSSASYDNISFYAFVVTAGWNATGIAFKPDGLTMYVVNNNNDNIHQYTLATAWDVSTASYSNKMYTLSEAGTGSPQDIVFKPDGTKYWVVIWNSTTGDRIFQYSMSTAWDMSTSSYDSVSFLTSALSIPSGLAFKPDGTRLFVAGYNGATDKPIRQVDLSTPWDLSTATYNNVTFDTSPVLGQVSSTDFPTSLHLNSDGTRIFVSTKGSDKIYEYAMSTAYDLSTISYNNVEFSVTTEETELWGITFSNDGTKMYAAGYNDTVYQYTTGSTAYGVSETWVNGTNNDEHATLQEALVAQASNRMNKAQLDAVADGYHFSQDSADTLDLMIAPYAASGASPISDGVTINYDAEALVREAVAGTDYIAEFPSPNRLDIKSLINGNLKIRAQ